MTNEDIDELKKLDDWIDKHPSLFEDWMKTSNALFEAIKALESQDGDLMPKKVVTRIIKEFPSYWGGHLEMLINREELIRDIEKLPPVTPQRPKGEWIKYEVDVAPHPLHCSLCGFSNHHISNRYMKEFRRCPNCGAEMNGGGE